jgi:hypothetical protein
LYDVLTEVRDVSLQVLTHPGWWQDKPMPPRQRVFRSAYGRAVSMMRNYDQGLEQHGRLNHAGPAVALQVLRSSQLQQFELCDFLWNQGALQTLFLELWRLHEAQINRLCKAYLWKEWRVPADEVNAFFGDAGLRVDGFRLFEAIFESPWPQVSNVNVASYEEHKLIRNQLVHGRASALPIKLEEGCIMLCEIMDALASWGKAQPWQYDGLAHLGIIGLPTLKTLDGNLSDQLDEAQDQTEWFQKTKWKAFKLDISVENLHP